MKRILNFPIVILLAISCSSPDKEPQNLKTRQQASTHLIYSGTVNGGEEIKQRQYEVSNLVDCVEAYCDDIYSNGIGTAARYNYDTAIEAVPFLKFQRSVCEGDMFYRLANPLEQLTISEDGAPLAPDKQRESLVLGLMNCKLTDGNNIEKVTFQPLESYEQRSEIKTVAFRYYYNALLAALDIVSDSELPSVRYSSLQDNWHPEISVDLLLTSVFQSVPSILKKMQDIKISNADDSLLEGVFRNDEWSSANFGRKRALAELWESNTCDMDGFSLQADGLCWSDPFDISSSEMAENLVEAKSICENMASGAKVPTVGVIRGLLGSCTVGQTGTTSSYYADYQCQTYCESSVCNSLFSVNGSVNETLANQNFYWAYSPGDLNSLPGGSFNAWTGKIISDNHTEYVSGSKPVLCVIEPPLRSVSMFPQISGKLGVFDAMPVPFTNELQAAISLINRHQIDYMAVGAVTNAADLSAVNAVMGEIEARENAERTKMALPLFGTPEQLAANYGTTVQSIKDALQYMYVHTKLFPRDINRSDPGNIMGGNMSGWSADNVTRSNAWLFKGWEWHNLVYFSDLISEHVSTMGLVPIFMNIRHQLQGAIETFDTNLPAAPDETDAKIRDSLNFTLNGLSGVIADDRVELNIEKVNETPYYRLVIDYFTGNPGGSVEFIAIPEEDWFSYSGDATQIERDGDIAHNTLCLKEYLDETECADFIANKDSDVYWNIISDISTSSANGRVLDVTWDLTDNTIPPWNGNPVVILMRRIAPDDSDPPVPADPGSAQWTTVGVVDLDAVAEYPRNMVFMLEGEVSEMTNKITSLDSADISKSSCAPIAGVTEQCIDPDWVPAIDNELVDPDGGQYEQSYRQHLGNAITAAQKVLQLREEIVNDVITEAHDEAVADAQFDSALDEYLNGIGEICGDNINQQFGPLARSMAQTDMGVFQTTLENVLNKDYGCQNYRIQGNSGVSNGLQRNGALHCAEARECGNSTNLGSLGLDLSNAFTRGISKGTRVEYNSNVSWNLLTDFINEIEEITAGFGDIKPDTDFDATLDPLRARTDDGYLDCSGSDNIFTLDSYSPEFISAQWHLGSDFDIEVFKGKFHSYLCWIRSYRSYIGGILEGTPILGIPSIMSEHEVFSDQHKSLSGQLEQTLSHKFGSGAYYQKLMEIAIELDSLNSLISRYIGVIDQATVAVRATESAVQSEILSGEASATASLMSTLQQSMLHDANINSNARACIADVLKQYGRISIDVSQGADPIEVEGPKSMNHWIQFMSVLDTGTWPGYAGMSTRSHIDNVFEKAILDVYGKDAYNKTDNWIVPINNITTAGGGSRQKSLMLRASTFEEDCRLVADDALLDPDFDMFSLYTDRYLLCDILTSLVWPTIGTDMQLVEFFLWDTRDNSSKDTDFLLSYRFGEFNQVWLANELFYTARKYEISQCENEFEGCIVDENEQETTDCHSSADASYQAMISSWQHGGAMSDLTQSTAFLNVNSQTENLTAQILQIGRNLEQTKYSMAQSLKAVAIKISELSALEKKQLSLFDTFINNVNMANASNYANLTEWKERFDFRREQYQKQLKRARIAAWIARRAIEFRFGVDLSEETAMTIFGDRPSDWANDIYGTYVSKCGISENLAEGETAVTSCLSPEERIEEYVQKLQDYVESYGNNPNDNWWFHEDDDTAVLSLRDHFLINNMTCGTYTSNMAYFSESMGMTQTDMETNYASIVSNEEFNATPWESDTTNLTVTEDQEILGLPLPVVQARMNNEYGVFPDQQEMFTADLLESAPGVDVGISQTNTIENMTRLMGAADDYEFSIYLRTTPDDANCAAGESYFPAIGKCGVFCETAADCQTGQICMSAGMTREMLDALENEDDIEADTDTDNDTDTSTDEPFYGMCNWCVQDGACIGQDGQAVRLKIIEQPGGNVVAARNVNVHTFWTEGSVNTIEHKYSDISETAESLETGVYNIVTENLIDFSEDFTDKTDPDEGWNTDSGVTVGMTDRVAPNGAAVATEIDFSAQTALYTEVTLPSIDEGLTASIWLRAEGIIEDSVTVALRLESVDVPELNKKIRFVDVTGDWRRYSVELPRPNSDIITYDDDVMFSIAPESAATLQVWGAQIEEGLGATVYLPVISGETTYRNIIQNSSAFNKTTEWNNVLNNWFVRHDWDMGLASDPPDPLGGNETRYLQDWSVTNDPSEWMAHEVDISAFPDYTEFVFSIFAVSDGTSAAVVKVGIPDANNSLDYCTDVCDLHFSPGNSWDRYVPPTVVKQPGNNRIRIEIWPTDDPLLPSLTGQVFIWGPQLEVGSVPTAYQDTSQPLPTGTGMTGDPVDWGLDVGAVGAKLAPVNAYGCDGNGDVMVGGDYLCATQAPSYVRNTYLAEHVAQPCTVENPFTDGYPLIDDLYKKYPNEERIKLLKKAFTHVTDDAGGDSYYVYRFNMDVEDIEKGLLGQYGVLAPDNFNYRMRTLAVNVVGTDVLNCSNALAPANCAANQWLSYDLMQMGDVSIRNHHDEANVRTFNIPTGNIRGGKAWVAEQVIGYPISGAHQNALAQMQKVSLMGRPLQGIFELRIYETPELNWEHVEDIQLVLGYHYWTKSE